MTDLAAILEKGAMILTYTQLRRALQGRRQSLGIGQKELDDITGAPDGYVAKLECGVKNYANSLDWVLQALDLVIIVAPKSCLGTAAPNASKTVLPQALNGMTGAERLKKIGSKGGKAWAAGLTKTKRAKIGQDLHAARRRLPPKVRAELARKAANARWARAAMTGKPQDKP